MNFTVTHMCNVLPTCTWRHDNVNGPWLVRWVITPLSSIRLWHSVHRHCTISPIAFYSLYFWTMDRMRVCKSTFFFFGATLTRFPRTNSAMNDSKMLAPFGILKGQQQIGMVHRPVFEDYLVNPSSYSSPHDFFQCLLFPGSWLKTSCRGPANSVRSSCAVGKWGCSAAVTRFKREVISSVAIPSTFGGWSWAESIRPLKRMRSADDREPSPLGLRKGWDLEDCVARYQ